MQSAVPAIESWLTIKRKKDAADKETKNQRTNLSQRTNTCTVLAAYNATPHAWQQLLNGTRCLFVHYSMR